MEIISFPLPHTLCSGADGSRLFTSRRSCLSLTVGELTVGRDAHRNQEIAKSGLRRTSSDGGTLNKCPPAASWHSGPAWGVWLVPR